MAESEAGSAAAAAAAAVLAETLLNEGGGPGNSLHSWRCEHPDRYGHCSCVEETAKEMAAALAAAGLLADPAATKAAAAQAWDEVLDEVEVRVQALARWVGDDWNDALNAVVKELNAVRDTAGDPS